MAGYMLENADVELLIALILARQATGNGIDILLSINVESSQLLNYTLQATYALDAYARHYCNVLYGMS